MMASLDARHASAAASQVPRSGAPAIVWPAAIAGEAGAILSILQQLELSQWWPEQQLREMQLRQLHLLLSHAQATTAFYRERLAAVGFRPDLPLTEETWQRIPLLERREVQDAGTSLRSLRPPASHGRTSEVTTTGSTGMPVRVLKTQISDVFWNACTLRDLRWHSRDVSGRLALIMRVPNGSAPWPEGVELPNWGRAVGTLYASGPACALDIFTPVDRQIDWLQRVQPAHLLTFPTNLHQIARRCRDRGITLQSLRAVSTMGELVGADLRADCRAAFGLALTDMYSAEEAGYMALQCPAHEHYHVQSEVARIEVLDAQDRPCVPGAIGRVVVTPLHNFAAPLVRYAIGDYAEVGPPCPCGRGLPVLRRILGRTRNMVRLPSGESHWAALESQRFAAVAPIIQYQIIQSQEGVEMKLVVRRELTEAEASTLRSLVQSALGHPFDVRLTYCDSIPRGPGGKYEEFRCDLPT